MNRVLLLLLMIISYDCLAQLNYGADSLRITGENISPVERATQICNIKLRVKLPIGEHPLIYANKRIKSSLGRIDTLINSNEGVRYISYSDIHLALIMWIKEGIKETDRYRLIKVYNENSNVIYEELLAERNNYVYRNRMVFNERTIPILDCIYENSGGKHGIIFLKSVDGKVYNEELLEDNCHCDW